MKSSRIYKFVFILYILFLSSCIHRKYSCEIQSVSLSSVSLSKVSLFIEMVQNKMVFENLSPIIYDVLWNHFNRVGFLLATHKKESFSLRIIIKSIEPSYKFFSPDVLTYSMKMKIELFCQLFDLNEKLVAQKQFAFATLISKSKEYILNSKFFDFECQKLLERNVHKIDQYFRPFFVENK